MDCRGWNLWVKSKYMLFRLLEKITVFFGQNPVQKSTMILGEPATEKVTQISNGYIWFFVSTIGELNAIGPLIEQIIKENPSTGIVFLTDHDQYTQAYQWQYPESFVIYHGDSAHGVSNYFNEYPPKLFLISEIPCLYADAPCRFSFRVIYELKLRDVPVIVVNGWLYGEGISCRMDGIENFLFSSDYLSGIDKFLVQTEEILRSLIDKGVDREKTRVTGNIKFDALALESDWEIESAESPAFLRMILETKRPCIVAGCVAEFDEAKLIVNGYLYAIKSIQNLLLIIAPRHPENQERMDLLVDYLSQSGIRFLKKSEYDDTDLANVDVIILDTIGELRDFYAISNLCYVGMNHNILEPLMYDKEVVILPGWESKYPTYPVYRELTAHGFVTEVHAEKEVILGMTFVEKITTSLGMDGKVSLRDKLSMELSGATENNLSDIRRFLN